MSGKKPWRQINRLTKKYADNWPTLATAGDLDVVASFVRAFKTLPDCIRAFATEAGVSEHHLDPIRRPLPEPPSNAKYEKRRKRLLADLAALSDAGDCSKVKESARATAMGLKKEMRAYPDIIDPRNSAAVNLWRDLWVVSNFADFYANPSAFLLRSFDHIDDDSIPFLSWSGYFAKWGAWAFLNPVALKGFASLASDEQRPLIELMLDPPRMSYTESNRGPDKKPRSRRVDNLATKLAVDDAIYDETNATESTRGTVKRIIAKVAAREKITESNVKKRRQRASKG